MAVMNDKQRKASERKLALRYPRTFKQKVAQLILKLFFVAWATKVNKEYNYTTIIQIFEGDGETAKSWELKNQKCHDEQFDTNTDDFVYPVTDKSELRRHPALLGMTSDQIDMVVRIEWLEGGDFQIVLAHSSPREITAQRVSRLRQAMSET